MYTKDEEPPVQKYKQCLCYKEIIAREGSTTNLERVLTIQPRHAVASMHIQKFLNTSDKNRELWLRIELVHS